MAKTEAPALKSRKQSAKGNHKQNRAHDLTKIISNIISSEDSNKASLISSVHCLNARAAFRSDAELAAELGVNRSSVSRWKQGQLPEGKNKEALINFDIVVLLLTDYLERDVIHDWLRGVNPMLGNKRPIDLLKHGRLSDVIAAIEAERSGAYA